MTRAHAVIAGLLLGVPGFAQGCGDDDSTMVDVPPPPPPTTGAADTSTGGDTASSTASEPVACRSSSECPDGQACVADFAIGDPTPPSSFTCRSECVAPGTISLWCSDDASCCEGVCGVGDRGADTDGGDDGLCRLPTDGTTSSGSGSSDDGSGSGSSASGSSGSGSSDGSSSGSSGSGTAGSSSTG